MNDSEEEGNARSFHESDYHDSSKRRKVGKGKSRIDPRLCLCCLYCTFSVVIVIVAVLVTMLAKERPITSSMTITSSLTSSLALRIKPMYCEKVALFAAEGTTDDVQVKLYLLEEAPNFRTINDYEVSVKFVVGNVSKEGNGIAWFESTAQFDTWMLYLNPDSTVVMTGCAVRGKGTAYYYVIQGEQNYSRWKDDQSGYNYHQLQICSFGPASKVPFSSEEADQYYFILMAPEGNRPTIDLNFNVSSVDYDPESYIDIPSCTANCSLESPPFMYHYALFEITALNSSANQSVPYGLPVQVNWICETREWAYLLVFGFLFLCGDGIVCCVCCCCGFLCWSLRCCKRNNRAEQQPLLKSSPTHFRTTAKIGPSATLQHHSHHPTHMPKPMNGSPGTQFTGL